MSRYYKAEDVISFLNVYCPKDMWEYQIADLPTIEVSEDCIDRYSALAELDPRSYEYKAVKELPSVIPTQNNTIQHVESVESVEKPKEGEWIESPYENADGMTMYRCSECGCLCEGGYNYCPNCGAKMKGADNE